MMAKKTTENAARLTRAKAATQAILSLAKGDTTTVTELVERVDSMVDGEPNPRASVFHLRRALEILEATGIVRLTRPTDLIIEKLQ